jgi:hypothetical protein
VQELCHRSRRQSQPAIAPTNLTNTLPSRLATTLHLPMSLPLFLIAIIVIAWAAILALALGMLHVATNTPTPQRPLPPRFGHLPVGRTGGYDA